MKPIFLLFLVLPQFCYSQSLFDFEDNTLANWVQSSENHWETSSVDPLNGSISLHHAYDNPSAGKDQISYKYPYPLSFSDTAAWSFKIKYDYNPSSANNWAVYLCSDKPSGDMYPDGSANAIVVGVNFTGSDDILKLYYIENKEITTLITTDLNWENIIGDTMVVISIEQYPDGIWNIHFSKNGNPLIFAGTCTSTIIPEARYFGVYYEYSSAQDRKLWIDDISFKLNYVADNVKPAIDTCYLVSPKQVKIVFNEPIIKSNLPVSVMQSVVSIDSTIFSTNEINVFTNTEFPTNKSVKIKVSGVTDLYNNVMNDTVVSIYNYKPAPYDIIVTEIMADPEPVVGLPPYEYIELYNRTDTPVNLLNWELVIGKNVLQLPSVVIRAYDYLVVTSENAIGKFNQINNVVYCISSESILLNDGTTIAIKDSTGQLISMTQYSSKWYDDNYKEEGGWSLELNDVYNSCGGEDSWLASENPLGGTPGKQNSTYKNNPDNILPEYKYLTVPNDSTLTLYFSEFLDSTKSLVAENFYLSPDIGEPSAVHYAYLDYSCLILNFNEKLQNGKSYQLKINSQVCDCVENPLSKIETEVAIPVVADSANVIINEILFNPHPEGSEFVEIFNRSDKVIDAGRLILATLDSLNGNIIKFCEVAPQGYPLFPNNFLVVTSNVKGLEKYYHLKNKYVCFEQSDFPPLDDEEGLISLMDISETPLDMVKYNESQHYILLNSKDGISLERVTAESSGMLSSNWHSASETAGFATPGYENSQQYKSVSDESDIVSITSEIFTPDNDGMEDYVTITISPQTPGFTASITIFSSTGNQVKRLVKNELLGETNSFNWDGTSDEPKLQPPGIYIIYIRLVSDKGEVKEYKKTCVLGYR